MLDFLAKCYEVRDDERQIFGSNWCGPDIFESHVETLVAKYAKIAGGDGQNVEVYCFAAPARFYTIKALPDTNSVGNPVKAWKFGTGSSMAQLVVDMATAASEGMLGFHED